MVPQTLLVLLFGIVLSQSTESPGPKEPTKPGRSRSLKVFDWMAWKNLKPKMLRGESGTGEEAERTNDYAEFEILASIVTDPNIKESEWRKKLSEVIPAHRTQRAKFTATAKILTAMFFAQGVRIDKYSDGSFAPVEFSVITAEKLVLAIAQHSYYSKMKESLSVSYKEHCAAGKNPIQAMSLAIENSMSPKTGIVEPPKPAQTKYFMGCKFEDKDYTYSPKDPSARWGKYPLLPKTFNSKDELKLFLDVLTEACSYIVKRSRYNDLDQLIRFTAEFKGQKSQSLEEFYESYKYPFRPFEDTASFELQLLTELIERKVQVKNHFYLINTFRILAIQKNKFKFLKDNFKRSTINNFSAHVAGAINIQVNKIKGYIIIDLNWGVPAPVVIMEKGGVEGYGANKGSAWTGKDGKDLVSYELFDAWGNLVVLATVFEAKTSSPIRNILYPVRKPYCDFLRTTFKPNLILNNFRGIMAETMVGTLGSRVSYRLAGDQAFHLISTNRTTGEKLKDTVFKFRNPNVFHIAEDDLSVLEDVAKDLGLSPDVLYGKMIAIQMLVSQDAELLNQMAQLRDRMKKIKAKDSTEPTSASASIGFV